MTTGPVRSVAVFSRFGRCRAASEVLVLIQSCCAFLKIRGAGSRLLAAGPLTELTLRTRTPHDMSLSKPACDDDVFYLFLLFLQKQKSAQSYIPQGYFPPYEAV